MIDEIDKLFKHISHGVYVIGVCDGELRNAFTAAWVMQVSFKPPLLALSINPAHYSYRLMQAGGVCTVNVLGQYQYALAEHFGRSGVVDKMAGFEWRTVQTGAPVLAQSLVYFDCAISHYTDAGDHQIAVCEVLAAGKLNEGKPLLYSLTGDLDGGSQLYETKKGGF